MVDAYRRKIESVENNIENSIQISSILLKLKGYDEKLGDLSKIDTNTNNVSSNLGKITTNEGSISSNLGKIDNIEEFLTTSEDFKQTHTIEKQIFRFNKNTNSYTIFEKEIEHEFTKNSLLFIDNNIYYKYDDLLDDYHRLQHQYEIYDDEDNLIYIYLFNKDTYYDENLDPILIANDDFTILLKKL